MMPNNNLSEAKTAAQFISDYYPGLLTDLAEDSPMSNLWQANVVIKNNNFLDDADVNTLWQYIQPSIAQDERIIWTARGDPALLPPFSNDFQCCLIFIVTQQNDAA